jgi:hypothetical protein
MAHTRWILIAFRIATAIGALLAMTSSLSIGPRTTPPSVFPLVAAVICAILFLASFLRTFSEQRPAEPPSAVPPLGPNAARAVKIAQYIFVLTAVVVIVVATFLSATSSPLPDWLRDASANVLPAILVGTLGVIGAVRLAHGFAVGLSGDSPGSNPPPPRVGLPSIIAILAFKYIGLAILVIGFGVGSALLLSNGQSLFGAVAALFSVALIIATWFDIRKLRRDVRTGMQTELRRINCCPHCEYDLRRSAVRCPECGAAIHSENVEV